MRYASFMVMVMVVAAAGFVRGGYAAEGAAAEGTQSFGWAAVPSLERVDQEIVRLGLAKEWDTAGLVESTVPRIFGEGSIDPKRPVGFLYLGREGCGPPTGAFVVPVRPGHATVEQLKEFGGVPVEGHADTVKLGPRLVARRTADALIGGSVPAAVVDSVGALPYLKTFQDAAVVMEGDFDIGSVRKRSPERWEAFWQEQPDSNPMVEWGRQVSTNIMRNILEPVDHVHLALAHRGERLALTVSATPSPLAGEGPTFAAPVMPPGAMVTANVVYANEAASHWVVNVWRTSPMDWFMKVANLTEKQRKQVMTMVPEVLDCYFGADAQSVALEMVNGDPVITVVNQYRREVNIPERMKAALKSMGAVDPTTVATFTPLTEGGSRGYVATMKGKGGAPSDSFVIGVMQKGRVATMVISPKVQANYAPAVLSATEKLSEPFSARGSFDAMMAAEDQFEEKWKALPAEGRERIRALLAHKYVTVDMVVKEKPASALEVTVGVPAGVVQAGALLMELSRER